MVDRREDGCATIRAQPRGEVGPRTLAGLRSRHDNGPAGRNAVSQRQANCLRARQWTRRGQLVGTREHLDIAQMRR
jgi:hypothetical protein